MKIYTIGFTQKSAEQFFESIKAYPTEQQISVGWLYQGFGSGLFPPRDLWDEVCPLRGICSDEGAAFHLSEGDRFVGGI